ncbi:uncharacterized protein LOC142341039 isoform X2 [Convolutriloba macropyga]|uniref:uncharacterized protein LOC142341039 isoform X2 n=1 Tax=Convolutriloba macropyga TaxID=536237 RepID=UPI003F524B6D
MTQKFRRRQSQLIKSCRRQKAQAALHFITLMCNLTTIILFGVCLCCGCEQDLCYCIGLLIMTIFTVIFGLPPAIIVTERWPVHPRDGTLACFWIAWVVSVGSMVCAILILVINQNGDLEAKNPRGGGGQNRGGPPNRR